MYLSEVGLGIVSAGIFFYGLANCLCPNKKTHLKHNPNKINNIHHRLFKTNKIWKEYGLEKKYHCLSYEYKQLIKPINELLVKLDFYHILHNPSYKKYIKELQNMSDEDHDIISYIAYKMVEEYGIIRNQRNSHITNEIIL